MKYHQRVSAIIAGELTSTPPKAATPTHVDPSLERLRDAYPDLPETDVARLTGRVRETAGQLEVLSQYGWMPASGWIRNAIDFAPLREPIANVSIDVVANAIEVSSRRRR